MSHKTVQMLRDIDGNLIPQFYDEKSGTFVAAGPGYEVIELAIASGADISAIADLGRYRSFDIMPDGWKSATDMSIGVALTATGTVRKLKREGAEVTIPSAQIAANEIISLSEYRAVQMTLRYVAIISGTHGTRVAQDDDRKVYLLCRE